MEASIMKNKKVTLIRLVIFLLIAFALPFIMIFIYIAKCGWTMEGDFYGIICSVAMLCPALANILTRIITKEGTADLNLNLRFNGQKKYYCIALLVPVLCSLVIVLCAALFLLPSDSLAEVLKNTNYGEAGSVVLYLISMSVSAFMFGFGEEFGWRGYLTPKLEKLMPSAAAILVTGVIWGLWHAPLIACGHDFGKGYWGDPWLGIILMCVACIGFSFYLTALTKATGSSLTAGVAHMAINNITTGLAGLMISGLAEDKLIKLSTELAFGYNVTAMSVLTVITLIVGAMILIRIKRSHATLDASVLRRTF